MSRLYVGTRKGLFVLERGVGAWEIVDKAFIGDPVTAVLADPRDETLYAALDLGHFGPKLHRSDDGGASWEELPVPSFPEQGGDTADAKALKMVWCLEAAGADRNGALWAGSIPGGLFKSADRGQSWKLNEALWTQPDREKWFGGGYDQPGIHSVCVDPRDSRRVVASVSCGGVWITEDEGASWSVHTQGMYAEYMPPERRQDPSIQDPHRVVQCRDAPDTFWAQHHNAAFRSTDGAQTWEEIHPPPSKFGFAVAAHPHDPHTAWFVPLVKDECRVPVDGKMVVTRTRDGGNSFEVLRNGLPQENAYDVVYRHGLDVDPTGEVLAMGSTSGSLWLSDDGGDSFASWSHFLPPVYCVRFG